MGFVPRRSPSFDHAAVHHMLCFVGAAVAEPREEAAHGRKRSDGGESDRTPVMRLSIPLPDLMGCCRGGHAYLQKCKCFLEEIVWGCAVFVRPARLQCASPHEAI
jgi:hypothetical protein